MLDDFISPSSPDISFYTSRFNLRKKQKTRISPRLIIYLRSFQLIKGHHKSCILFIPIRKVNNNQVPLHGYRTQTPLGEGKEVITDDTASNLWRVRVTHAQRQLLRKHIKIISFFVFNPVNQKAKLRYSVNYRQGRGRQEHPTPPGLRLVSAIFKFILQRHLSFAVI